ncbi:MAG: LysR family transcriptional regulator [Deltaproteobacteria bacterium]|nr:LysR family transcriptional regulator [Deltaproteobacteria bacterium]
MDWRTVDFDWNLARAFLVAAEEGSYSAGARALGVAQPTIGRQVAALERALGVTLVERVGRGLELTPTGLELVEHVRAMGEAASRVSLAAAGNSTSLDGVVCITASEVISAFLLPPIVARIRQQHPGIEVEIVATNEARDLRRREADIAVRNFRPRDPELFARKIQDGHARLYAAPAYLERLGAVAAPADLARASFFGFDRTEMMIDGLRALGIPVGPRNFPIVTSNHLVQWELARQGLGICVMMEEIGDPEPRVRRVLPELQPLPVPLWLTSHRELRTSRRIRVVFDLLAEGLPGGVPSGPDGAAGPQPSAQHGAGVPALSTSR